jgi:hypothetical protein
MATKAKNKETGLARRPTSWWLGMLYGRANEDELQRGEDVSAISVRAAEEAVDRESVAVTAL